MKIIIVGAGITGLSTYLHLLKHLPNSKSHTITIYESHKPRSSLPSSNPPISIESLSTSTALVGGGLGVSPNGMRVLWELDEDLHDAVAAQGFPTEHFVFKGANGWVLGMQRTGDGKVRKEGEKEEICIASSRHGLWSVIMKTVGEGVVQYKKVISIGRDPHTGQVIVRTLDSEGNEGEDVADLLIGADGVKSVVRTALLGGEGKYTPQYLGQSGVGGFINQPIPKYIRDNKAMVFTFGGAGFFGYSSGGPASAESVMWWSTFETSSLPSTNDINPTEIKKALIERHKNWKDPVLQDIILKAEVQSIYPTWVLPELPNWGERGIVLVGDAAHAMDPTTGQGASQGLEDSKTLALLLAKCMKRSEAGGASGPGSEKEAVALAIKLYHQIRSPRVSEIVERGKKLAGKKANVGIILEYVTYVFLWLLNKFPSFGKFMLGDVNRSLYAWSAEDEIQKAFREMGSSS
ncbi:FAD/NAD(P)-binding domain-containing protein [Lindgomyces ingoldianus]|uniref:FAD/NAD(P)-binding domain-containing protein n=1 Tax=Lindgomyces ingoldianus TaxID=673940 RepID=A0ACB6QZB8_9PLEO|nr:FAD/NAD(P)-binding domain-containing protein [Lindgomyces ingoldianus]KAF2471880.1 FAD/NAD(P)-binding domain-containing protein [Lindgomyces ingoldianus]